MAQKSTGVAAPFRGYETIPADLLDPFTRAVSIAVRVPAGVFETVTDRPTQENAKLPDIGVPICGVCIRDSPVIDLCTSC